MTTAKYRKYDAACLMSSVSLWLTREVLNTSRSSSVFEHFASVLDIPVKAEPLGGPFIFQKQVFSPFQSGG